MASSQAEASPQGTTPSPRQASSHASTHSQLERNSSPCRAHASSPSVASEHAAEAMALEAMASALVAEKLPAVQAGKRKREVDSSDLQAPVQGSSNVKSRAIDAQQSHPWIKRTAASSDSSTAKAAPSRRDPAETLRVPSSTAAAVSPPSLLARMSPRDELPIAKPQPRRRGGHPARERRLERRRLERLAREGEEGKAEQAKIANRS